jgi:hypothetical protein
MSEDTRRMLQPAAIGGVVFGVLSGIPVISLLNCACCAYAIGGGMLAAHLYFKDLPAVAQQSYGEGAMLGLLTGGIGATVTTVIGIPMRLFIGAAAGLGSMDRLNEILGDADLPAGIADLVGSLAGGGISIGFILIGFFMRLISYGLFAMVGGIIGVAVFQKKMAAELT